MSEWNTIYNLDKEIVGLFSHGVAWTKKDRVRLGEYDDDFVYDNEMSVVAKICEGTVLDIIGETIGKIVGRDLFIADKKVGSFIGYECAGAAAIVLLFSKYSPVFHNK